MAPYFARFRWRAGGATVADSCSSSLLMISIFNTGRELVVVVVVVDEAVVSGGLTVVAAFGDVRDVGMFFPEINVGMSSTTCCERDQQINTEQW
jgi:hypothetical protein